MKKNQSDTMLLSETFIGLLVNQLVAAASTDPRVIFFISQFNQQIARLLGKNPPVGFRQTCAPCLFAMPVDSQTRQVPRDAARRPPAQPHVAPATRRGSRGVRSLFQADGGEHYVPAVTHDVDERGLGIHFVQGLETAHQTRRFVHPVESLHARAVNSEQPVDVVPSSAKGIVGCRERRGELFGLAYELAKSVFNALITERKELVLGLAKLSPIARLIIR